MTPPRARCSYVERISDNVNQMRHSSDACSSLRRGDSADSTRVPTRRACSPIRVPRRPCKQTHNIVGQVVGKNALGSVRLVRLPSSPAKSGRYRSRDPSGPARIWCALPSERAKMEREQGHKAQRRAEVYALNDALRAIPLASNLHCAAFLVTAVF